MNAKDLANKVKGLETVEEVTEILNEEKANKNRKTVVDACEERIGELTTASDSTSSAPDNLGSERAQEFLRKIPFGCRGANVVEFANQFFGNDLKSADHDKKSSAVKIVLKDGEEINARGI
jgi:hypothetical protein